MFVCVYSHPLKSNFETSMQLLNFRVLTYLVFQCIYKNACFFFKGKTIFGQNVNGEINNY